jgi:hypothetical protein
LAEPLFAELAELSALEQTERDVARAIDNRNCVKRTLNARFDKWTDRHIFIDTAPTHRRIFIYTAPVLDIVISLIGVGLNLAILWQCPQFRCGTVTQAKPRRALMTAQAALSEVAEMRSISTKNSRLL